MKKWTHNELLQDLAQHLEAPERMVWMDMQLGPSGSPRPDVYTLNKSYTKPMPLAYEIKVSVADFRSDITSGKWQSYLKFAAGVIFCVPAGLITKMDLPSGCGLMYRSDDGWRKIKGPTLHPVQIPTDAFMKLLIDGISRASRAGRKEFANEWMIHDRIKSKLGENVARALKDSEALIDEAKREAGHIVRRAENDARRNRDEADRLAQDIERHRQIKAEAIKELAQALGLSRPEFVTERSVMDAAKEFVAVQSADYRLSEARTEFRRAMEAMQRMDRHLKDAEKVAQS